MSRARLTEASEECVWGLCPVSNPRSGVPSTRPVGRSSRRTSETWETKTLKRAMVSCREARENGAMTFVECLGVTQEDTMEGSLWRKTLGRSLGSHEAAELVGGMCHVWLPARNHPPPRYTLHKYGMDLSQSSAPPGTGSIPPQGRIPICRLRHMAIPT